MGQARQRGTFEERQKEAISKRFKIGSYIMPRRTGKSILSQVLALISRQRMIRLRGKQNESNYQFHQEQIKLFNKLNNIKVIEDDAQPT